MANNKSAKMDPLEAAKVTDAKLRADAAALGETKPVNPASPPPVTQIASPPPIPVAPAPTSDAPPAVDPLSAAAPIAPEKTEVAPPLRSDGPTIEVFVASGYEPEHYPPDGYAEVPSPGLTRFRAGSPIPEEWIEQARRELDAADAAERGEPLPEPKRIVHVVLKDGRANVGHGQTAVFRKGDVLDEAGYGSHGIKRLADQGLELERQER